MRVLWCQWESMWPLQAIPRACTTSVHMATPWIWLAMMKAALLKPEISRILSYLRISWLPLRYGQRRLLLNSLEVFALCNMKKMFILFSIHQISNDSIILYFCINNICELFFNLIVILLSRLPQKFLYHQKINDNDLPICFLSFTSSITK